MAIFFIALLFFRIYVLGFKYGFKSLNGSDNEVLKNFKDTKKYKVQLYNHDYPQHVCLHLNMKNHALDFNTTGERTTQFTRYCQKNVTTITEIIIIKYFI